MDDLEKKLRRHYDGQQLPANRVQEILAAGRAVSAKRARSRWWQLAAAAAVILTCGIVGGSALMRSRAQHAEAQLIPLAEITNAVVRYFADPNYQLPQVSADRGVLVEWLRLHGGPDKVPVPSALSALSSYGCQVLNVQGQQVYLLCFLLETPPVSATAGAMPVKKMMVTVGPDGQMMKKTVPLVHLLVVPKGKFASVPRSGERVVLAGTGDWNFTIWSEGDQVLMAAAALPAERLLTLVGRL